VIILVQCFLLTPRFSFFLVEQLGLLASPISNATVRKPSVFSGVFAKLIYNVIQGGCTAMVLQHHQGSAAAPTQMWTLKRDWILEKIIV
jgi:hypothetical protein